MQSKFFTNKERNQRKPLNGNEKDHYSNRNTRKEEFKSSIRDQQAAEQDYQDDLLQYAREDEESAQAELEYESESSSRYGYK